MKAMNMKALALAVLSLGAAGSAMAVCPTDPAAPAGPWASKAVTQGNLAIITPGLNSTACALQVSLNLASAAFAKAAVTDTTPVDEPHYRARFYINTAELAAMNSALRQVKIFTASSTNSPAGIASDEVAMSLVGSPAGPFLRVLIADNTQLAKFRVIDVNPLPASLGANRIEFDLVQGASSTFRYWVTTAAAVTTDGAPTGTATVVDNTPWSGVTQASLGLFSANAGYRANVPATAHLVVDEFDSRRSTFIGL